MTRRSYGAILFNCEKEFAVFFSTRCYFFLTSELLVSSFSKDINGFGNLYQVAKGKKFSIDLVSLMLLLELSDQLDYCSFRRLELFSASHPHLGLCNLIFVGRFMIYYSLWLW